MPRKVVRVSHLADILVVRQRRGKVYVFLTINRERKTLRLTCPGFDFMRSVMVAELRLRELYPQGEVEWDRIQVERGVAFGWLD
jgi:hypothetical protein